MSLLDAVVEFVKVVASELAGPSSAVLYNVTGAPGFRLDASGEVTGTDDADDAGEQATSQTAYQALGLLARPLPPDSGGYCEAAAMRSGDGLEPFAYRDLRINAAVNASGGQAPGEGQILLAGYGGGFVSLQPTEVNTGSRKGDKLILYVPGDFDGDGVAQKSHAIVIDPTPGNSSIQLVHSDGVFFTLTEDVGNGEPGVSMATGAAAFARFSESEFVVQCPNIMLKGACAFGNVAEAAAPVVSTSVSASVALSVT